MRARVSLRLDYDHGQADGATLAGTLAAALVEAGRVAGLSIREASATFVGEDEQAGRVLTLIVKPGECCCGHGEAEEDRLAVLRCPVHGQGMFDVRLYGARTDG